MKNQFSTKLVRKLPRIDTITCQLTNFSHHNVVSASILALKFLDHTVTWSTSRVLYHIECSSSQDLSGTACWALGHLEAVTAQETLATRTESDPNERVRQAAS
jgi:hypothetical protein